MRSTTTTSSLITDAMPTEDIARVIQQTPFWDLCRELLAVLDSSGQLVYTNAAWQGLHPGNEAATERSFAALLAPEDQQEAVAHLSRLSADAPQTSFEARLQDQKRVLHHFVWKAVLCGSSVFLSGQDVTELRESEKAVDEAYQKLTFYMVNSPLAFVEWDRGLRISYWSPETERIFGWMADEVVERRPQDWLFLHEEDSPDFLGIMASMADTDQQYAFQCRHYRKDGQIVYCEWYHSALRDDMGEIVSIFSLCANVTERKHKESELLTIRQAVESASDAICITDSHGAVIHINQAFQVLFGYALKEIHTGGIEVLFSDTEAAHEVMALVDTGFSWKQETELLSQCGESIPALLRASAIRDKTGNPVGCILVCTDLRERKQAEQELRHQALHDMLTGLPNRSYFNQRLNRAFARCKQSDRNLACMFLDLDNFKIINDGLGHEVGDSLLKVVSERLQACIHSDDMVARLGGDEFVILLEEIKSLEDAEAVANQVSLQLKQPISLAGREVIVTGSLGIAHLQASHQQASDLLRDADVAMYQAKTGGKATYTVFNASMNAQAMERLELEMDLRRVLDRKELEVYYQPIIHLESGELSEVEALVRWIHPVRGIISPVKFIPIAEETGLITQLGEWVLEQACTHVTAWHQCFPSVKPLTLSVNLSTRQLQQENIVEIIERVLKQTGLNSRFLKLEITESVMMSDSESNIAKLHALRALGIRLAVDDFGTGYSSMAYLSSLPIDTLKIDRAFISRLGTKTEDDAIVRAIITMARTMGLFVTAEGIETDEQLSELNALGCDRGQGYYFAKPLPITEMEKMLANTGVEEVQEMSFGSEKKRRAA